MDVYKCPSLDTPFRRDPELIYWYTEPGLDDPDVVRFTGEISETSYFCDEARIAKESLPQRAILADGIEIGEVIWGAFAIIQQVENDHCAGIHGFQFNSPDHSGLGNW